MTERIGTDRTTKRLPAVAALGLWAWFGSASAVAQDPAPGKRGYSVTEASARGRDFLPILCRDTNSPAAGGGHAPAGSATQYDVTSDLYKVPRGKRLIVEYLSATAHDASDTNSGNFQGTTTQSGNDHDANFNEWADTAPYSAASQPIRLYADAGTTVTVDAYTSGQNAMALDFSLSSYLVNVPYKPPVNGVKPGMAPASR